jgi:hypothetical protein
MKSSQCRIERCGTIQVVNDIASGASYGVVRISKQDKSVRSKQDRCWSRRVEEENGHGILCGRCCEDGVVAVWMKATDDL